MVRRFESKNFGSWENLGIAGDKVLYDISLEYSYKSGPQVMIYLDVLDRFGTATECLSQFAISASDTTFNLRWRVPPTIVDAVRFRLGSGGELVEKIGYSVTFDVPLSNYIKTPQIWGPKPITGPAEFLNVTNAPLWRAEPQLFDETMGAIKALIEKSNQRMDVAMAKKSAVIVAVPIKPEPVTGRKIILFEGD